MRGFASRVLAPIALAASAFAPLASIALPPRAPSPNELTLRARTFVPAASRQSAVAARGRHLLIQYEAGRRKEALAGLRARGVRVLEAVPRNAVSAWVPAGADPSAAPGVRWVGTLAAADKVSLRAEHRARNLSVLVDVFPDVPRSAALAAIRRAGGKEVPNRYLHATTLHVEIAASALDSLAAQDEVSFIYAASAAIEQNQPVVRCMGALAQGMAVASYSIASEGWDGPGLGSAALHYYFVNGTPDVANEQSEVTRALATWSSVAQVAWAPAVSAREPRSIDFLWATGNHGDGSPFDGPGQTIAHALLPAPPNAEPEAGDVHFDDDEPWRIGADVDVYTVALHEIGHALGLGHSDDPSAVMYAYYGGPVAGLGSEDVFAIRTIYAQNGPSPGDFYEPDDAPALARPFGQAETHSIAPASDVDFRTFTLSMPADVTIAAIPADPADDTLLTLYDAQGAVLEVNDDTGASPHSTLERSRAGGDPLPAGTYYASIEESGRDAEIRSYDVTLATTSYPGPDGFEPDDSLGQASPLPGGWQAQSHTISPAGDKDYSVFTLDQLSVVTIDAQAYLANTPHALEMWLLANDGSVIEHSGPGLAPGLARIDRTRADQDWLPAGTYYVVVAEQGDDAEIDYTVRYEAYPVLYGGDDAYEDNDTLATASDFSAYDYTAFSSVAGSTPYQFDDDYYRIEVPRTGRLLRLSCGFQNLIDLELLGAAGNRVVSTVGLPQDGFSRILPSSGTYYVRVFGGNAGAAYDCTWRTENERPLIPPENDDFANARPMSALHELAYGDTYLATTEAGEPAHAGEVGGRSVWFTFTAPSSGDFSISTRDSLDTVLAVYRGNRVDQLTLVAENDDAQGALTSRVEFRATANETLAVAVDARGGAQGYFSLLGLPVLAPPPPDPPPPPPPPPAQISWSSFKSKCKASTGACKIKGKLRVTNPSNGPMTISVNTVLGADSDPHNGGDTLVRVNHFPTVAAGAQLTLAMKTKLTAARGKYLIAVAVSDGGNQWAAFGPLR